MISPLNQLRKYFLRQVLKCLFDSETNSLPSPLLAMTSVRLVNEQQSVGSVWLTGVKWAHRLRPKGRD